ncbi:hypothetical protein Ssi03_54180 [Sphaerisporangium siamense]|uniref:DUF4383 domain-containing protein n=1 Tax=Sphaerisporangium siamense TaxID=795645 RepID=A0A7W7D6I2_9ACTN|nr:DUF6220 domain-containing protein [Sphaerisporangium siamense]MBB4701204.1 hypothetical protein [Sphaerisporangium siamense]GII87428.1 hypothetical protein Ssi03_54180 [Sphaerisporangium siamense]
MRKVYVAVAGLMLLAVIAQFYFAAVGAFDSAHDDDSFVLHSMTGMMIIPVLSILATVAAAVAKAPGRMIGMTILPLGLVIVQVLIIVLGGLFNDSADNTTPVSLAILGLHALNGMAVMGVSGTVFAQARKFATMPAATSATAPDATARVS